MIRENVYEVIQNMLSDIAAGEDEAVAIDFAINCLETVVGHDFDEDTWLNATVKLHEIVNAYIHKRGNK